MFKRIRNWWAEIRALWWYTSEGQFGMLYAPLPKPVHWDHEVDILDDGDCPSEGYCENCQRDLSPQEMDALNTWLDQN